MQLRPVMLDQPSADPRPTRTPHLHRHLHAHRHLRRRLQPALRLTALVMTVGLLAMAPSTSFAREWTSGQKFTRGVSNMTLGVLAWPGTMAQEYKERGPAVGLPLGFVTGLGWFVAHEIVGVYEFMTCVFEAPPGFRPIMEPEYPWQYFEGL